MNGSNAKKEYSTIPFAAASLLAAPLLCFAGAGPAVHVAAGSAVALVNVARKSIIKYSDIAPLFHVSAVWRGVEENMYHLHLLLCMWLGMMITVLESAGWMLWVWSAVLALLYVAEYIRVFTRSTIFLSPAKEELIKKTQRGPVFKKPVQYVDSESRSAELFNEVIRIMETRKPWLQEDFGAEDLARMTRTNRLYLSKAINFHSGRNFSQLVNYYRVQYAIDLMRKDPGLKIGELSHMCGFHTAVSFHTAFKLNEQMTPGQYVKALKARTLRPRS